MKKQILLIGYMLLTVALGSCTKQDSLSSQPIAGPKLNFISFIEDTIAVNFLITSARKESIGNVFTTTIEGKLPDSIFRKNSLVIRVTGDSARSYPYTEIFASYTDSAGNTYANNIADTTNKLTIAKIEKRKDGTVDGNFTIRVCNFTKTKILLLKNGKFSTLFSD